MTPQDHSFGQDAQTPGERRTLLVASLTLVMMAVEIAGGLAYGSMAVLADGLHMASHASAMLIAVFAYRFARRHARSERFNFGTGKVNSLAAFASAVLLLSFAAYMAVQSLIRLLMPQPIRFDHALAVAVAGLVVNVVCAVILREEDHHQHEDGNGREHSGERGDHDRDLNRRSAYIHVLADALTSVLAIAAILAAKWTGLQMMDPIMGLVGAALVTRWAVHLIVSSSRILLDMAVDRSITDGIRRALESREGFSILDLHVWSIAPGIFAGELTIAADAPKGADEVRALLPPEPRLRHITIEVQTRAQARRDPVAVGASDDARPASGDQLRLAQIRF